MRAQIIYFDERLENHLKFQESLSHKFKASFYNDRDLLLSTISKDQKVDLIVLDDYSENDTFFEFLNDVLMAIDSLQVGVILTSSSNDVQSRIKAYDYGIDDYLKRPLSSSELNARLMNKVRKYREPNALELNIGNLCLNITDQRAKIDGVDKFLTPIEFKILLTLSKNPNRIHSKEALVSSLWAGETYGKSKAIDTHICNLRKKILGFSYSIRAIKGRGISLVESRVELSS